MVIDIYDKRWLKDVFVEGVDALIPHGLRYAWSAAPHEDLNEIVFQVES